ncbi:3-oxoacyl-[acyl-carrier protein] reductase [Novosphingobium sp. PhB165]|uniref:SDR family NAD(P)-dependent oxidoreductase n=1 Tax=Novosphingobium sp. PhB165 TaxID=2485105 RepID=UPI0010EE622E|nr:SDR family oxidoreductase [Novosphingobium sp. PhB165]TCM15410.1 3-oxoacyl-[acyl-carrier protein] reductase [Novosphingobium sp. PhB165]
MGEGVLAGKVALVTGAGRGIGRAIALRLAQDGARLAVHYSGSEQGALETAKMIRDAGGEAMTVRADIARRDEVRALFAAIDEGFGRLDVVVNSAGVSGGGSLADLDDEQLEWMLGVNLRGPLYVASEAARRLGEGGRIVNLSSSLSEFPMAGSGVYSATKVAIKSLTESWAKELGRKGVTVNTVIPGATAPGMMDKAPEATRAFFENASPFGRIGTAGEIADVVAFLASPQASWVSGAHIMANGAANT